jgi:hypothetical protein
MALADSAPKLMAEMLNTLQLYGCARPAPMVTRKSCDGTSVGCMEWLIHS